MTKEGGYLQCEANSTLRATSHKNDRRHYKFKLTENNLKLWLSLNFKVVSYDRAYSTYLQSSEQAFRVKPQPLLFTVLVDVVTRAVVCQLVTLDWGHAVLWRGLLRLGKNLGFLNPRPPGLWSILEDRLNSRLQQKQRRSMLCWIGVPAGYYDIISLLWQGRFGV